MMQTPQQPHIDNDQQADSTEYQPTSVKRRKCEANEPPAHSATAMMVSPTSIRAVLSDELTLPVPVETVVCARLARKADISLVMRALVTHVPMLRLQHLKRVRNDQRIILFAARDVCDEMKAAKIEAFPQNFAPTFADVTTEQLMQITRVFLAHKGVEESLIEIVCSLPIELHSSVASLAPQLRWQYDIANALWPCKFHVNRAAEMLYENRSFTAAQTEKHLLHMRIAMSLSRQCAGRPTGVAIDPRNGSVLAVGVAQGADVHPLMHSAMCLIDSVARSQNAGAWNEWPNVEHSKIRKADTDTDDGNVAIAASLSSSLSSSSSSSSSTCLEGVPHQWRMAINSEFPNVCIGAQLIEKQQLQHLNSLQIGDDSTTTEDLAGLDNLAKYGPYLCTGYDVYLTEEPCMLCAMALVHSRSRTVFYHRAQANGVLGSLAKLHTVKALNHHYDVFQIC